MRIPGTAFNIDLVWWQTEFKEHPQKHIGPLCVTAATTLLVIAIWGKYQALSFVCLAVVSYPFTHYQIEYLMFLDVHETAYAVAVVGIQLFCMQFPYLSQWGLPMSVALAYSFTVRGMRIRQILQDQKTEISKSGSLNQKFKEENDLLLKNMDELKTALQTLAKQVLKKQELAQVEEESKDRKQDTVIEIEKDYTTLNTELKLLTDVCNKYIKEEGIQEQIDKIDENAQIIQKQTSEIRLRNTELQGIIGNLEIANQTFNDLIRRAQQGELEVQEGLKQFHAWLLSLNTTHSLM